MPMLDPVTLSQFMPSVKCADCGLKGCTIWHNGRFVPTESPAPFCENCWQRRVDYYNNFRRPLPVPRDFSLEQLKVTIEFFEKKIRLLEEKKDRIEKQERQLKIILSVLKDYFSSQPF